MLDPGFKVKIKRMDSRYTGYPVYSHYATIISEDFSVYHTPKYGQFHKLRVWCWDNYGPSCELSMWAQSKNSGVYNPHWCWMTEHGKLRILLDAEAAALVAITF
jgi:hypothetical protein